MMKASDLRAKAWESLRGCYWYAVLAAFLAAFFGALIAGSGNTSINVDSEILQPVFERFPTVLIAVLAVVGTIGTILNLVAFVLGGVVQIGYAQYLLKQHDREIASVKDLFSKFDYFGQAFLQKFLRALYTFLWSLLFIVPGIVKAYSYAMTPFIMAENPNMTAKEAITASKQLMNGHKWELFCLDFSFIGWQLLVLLTAGIGAFFLNPYVEAAHAAFYRDKIAPRKVVYTQQEYTPIQ
jgi:uncharacterized membrane protein